MDQTDGSGVRPEPCGADIIARAKHIYIVGFRSSSFLAGYLNFYFRLIYDNVTQVQGVLPAPSTSSSRGSGDVVIAICFPRYSELGAQDGAVCPGSGARPSSA